MERKRILIDMDEVMADITQHFINWYKEKTGVEVPYAHLVGKHITDAFPEGHLIREFLYTPGFFRTAPLMEGAVEVVEELNKHYEVFIVSAAMEFPQSLIEKYDWLKEHFPFIHWQQIMLCGSKKPVSGDYMIDDHLKNLDFFQGHKIIFTAPHNANVVGDYTRVNSWADVKAFLLSEEKIQNKRTAETAVS